MTLDPSFHYVVFPEDISYGSTGGPGFNTTVITLSSGYEQRNVNWQDAKASYEVTYGVKTGDQMQALIDFFYARMGKAYGFLYKDWADFKIEDEPIFIFDGTPATAYGGQMIKRYEPATNYFYDRQIKRPNLSSIDGGFHIVQPNGVTTDFNANQVGIDYASGTLSFNLSVPVTDGSGQTTFTNVPPAGSKLICDYMEFYVPCRFDTDEMKISQDDWNLESWPSIELVELKV